MDFFNTRRASDGEAICNTTVTRRKPKSAWSNTCALSTRKWPAKNIWSAISSPWRISLLFRFYTRRERYTVAIDDNYPNIKRWARRFDRASAGGADAVKTLETGVMEIVATSVTQSLISVQLSTEFQEPFMQPILVSPQEIRGIVTMDGSGRSRALGLSRVG